MKKFNIKPGESMGSYLDTAISQMLNEDRGIKANLQQKALEEKDKQQVNDKEDEDIFDDSEEQEVSKQDSEQSSNSDNAEIGRQMGGPQKKMADDDVEALKTTPEMTDIIDKLNAVRSGRSFKDEDIKNSFDDYYTGLDNEEKIALFAFLKGIAQVTSGEVSGHDAVEPDTHPSPGIEMKQSNTSGEQSKSIKPNVIKKPDVPNPKQSSGKNQEEDTTSPVPVQPKRRV